MNIKHISLAFAVVAAALFAGCAKNPIEEVKPSEQLTDLELSYVGATETKAVIDGTTFPQEGEIGLFFFKDEMATQDYGDGYKNVKYAYNSSKSKWTASPSIKVGSTPGHLYGYYPYSATATNVKAITVKSSLNGDDVMYATKQTVTDATASQTSITMNHALARVSIKVINNGYTGKAELSKIKFSGAKIAPEGTLNALDGKITATNSDVTLDVPTANQTITATGSTYECLLVPSAEDSGKQTINLTLTIDGQEKTATLSGDNGVIIAQGTKSNITINLSNSGISVQTVSVENWNVVEVGEYKVTVKVDETDATANDILIWAYGDGNTAKIEAFSKSNKSLGCVIAGDAQCQKTKSANIYTFTISDLSSDITANIGYQHVTGISLNKNTIELAIDETETLSATIEPEDAVNKTIIWSSDDDSIATVDENGKVTAIAEGEAVITAKSEDGGFTANCTVTIIPSYVSSVTLDRTSVNPAKGWIVNLKATIAPEDAPNKNVSWSSDNTSVAEVDANGNVIALAVGTANITVTTEDGGKTATCAVTVGEAIEGSLPYEFSVSTTKKIHFSKGNLYCSGVEFNTDKAADNYGTVKSMDNAQWGFESNQYDTTPSKNTNRNENHISHFMWCDNATDAMALKYESKWDGANKTFFAAKNFTVNGYSGWSVLTGGDDGEWKYLINYNDECGTTVRSGKYKYGVTVCGKTNCLVLLPDDWKWDKNTVGTDWQDGGYPETSADKVTWQTMETAGAVCLPAAGCRKGNPFPADVTNFGSAGYYWSASPNDAIDAYGLYFNIGNVNPFNNDARSNAQSVRLVTECQ